MAAVFCVSRVILTSYKLMAGFWIQLIAWSIFIRPAVSENLGLGSFLESAMHTEKLVRDFSHHELVIPKVYSAGHIITNTLARDGHVKDITITFHAFNQDFVLDLLKNSNLFSSVYVEKLVHSSQNQRETRLPVNHTESHCYYHGRLRGTSVLSSSVAVSTCRGIRGQISAAEDLYFIEPVDGPPSTSLSTAHYIFKHSEPLYMNMTCGQTTPHPRTKRASSDDEMKRERRSKSGAGRAMEPRDADDLTRYVELYVVNDYSQYAVLKYRAEEVIRRTKDIINIVNSIYRPLNIYVVLVGVEVWTGRNEFAITSDSEYTMNKFLEYRRTRISPFHRNDNAQLIIGQELGNGIVGKAPIMTICTYRNSGGVNADRHTTLGAISTTVAHEMGHNFGLYHDLDSCECEDARCVMSSGGGLGNPSKFSSCSRQVLSDAFHQGMDYCLRNIPQLMNVGPTCGNGFTEDGEDCDCGLEKDCANRCCNASTCRLAPNSTCATGHCCDLSTCQPISSATECRASHGFCDLPEFCDGVSERCPSDVYREDGVECQENGVGSFCYDGKCRTHDGQCQMLWGRTGKMSHGLCYEHFNIMGNAHGHCGFNWTDETFQRCQPKDVLCGMLHCEHRSEKLMFWKEALMFTMPDTYIRINDQRHDCKAAIMDVGLDMPDPGLTFDGVKCGDSQICMSHHCVPVDSLKTIQCPDCHGHGVCNSLGQCHCDLGYAPPFCDRQGLGGSVHSGPALKYPNRDVGLIVGLCFLFLIVIPFIVILTILSYRRYDQLKLFLVRRCRLYQTSSFYMKRFQQKADVKDIELSSSEVTFVQSAPVVSAKSPGIHRATSFRPEDISSPRLESSTNSTLNLPKTPVSLVHANSCRAAITYDECRKSSPPPRPAPPKFPFQKDVGKPTALSSNSLSSHASDHSSTSGAGDSHYLLPKHDSHKEEEEGRGFLQPCREAPLPPYACPNKKKQASFDLSPKKVMKPRLDSPDAEQPLLETKSSAGPVSASQYVNVPSVKKKKSEDHVPALSSFSHQPSKNNNLISKNETKPQLKKPSNSKISSSESRTASSPSESETKSELQMPCIFKISSSKNEAKSKPKKPSYSVSSPSKSGTKPELQTPCNFKISSSENDAKSQSKKPSYSVSSPSESGTKPQLKKPCDFPAASVSQLKSAFEATSPNSNLPPLASNSVSPRTENLHPFRRASSTGRADTGRSPTASVDMSSSPLQTSPPKWPPYGRLETISSGVVPHASPSVGKLQHCSSDRVTSAGRIARPTVAPKPPPSGVRTSNKN